MGDELTKGEYLEVQNILQSGLDKITDTIRKQFEELPNKFVTRPEFEKIIVSKKARDLFVNTTIRGFEYAIVIATFFGINHFF